MVEELSREVLDRLRVEPVAVFGTGREERFIAEMVEDIGGKVQFFIDDDVSKMGNQIGTAYVITIDQFMKLTENIYVLLSVNNGWIEKKLLELGINGNRIVNLSRFNKGRKISFFDEYCQKDLPKDKYIFLRKEDRMQMHTAISKIGFCEGILFIQGWVIPSSSIDKVTININKTKEVLALREERDDVVKNYPYCDTKNCGFFYIDHIDLKEDIVIEILFWVNHVLMESIVQKCVYKTAYDFLSEYYQSERYVDLIKVLLGKQKYLLLVNKNIADIIRNNEDKFKGIKDKLCIYQIKYYLGLFENKDMKKYMDLIEHLEDVDGQAYLCEQEIPYMIFLHPELKVDSLYQWQRKMYHYIAEKIYVGKRTEKNVINRIVILVDCLSTNIYASAIFEIGIANKIQEKGYQVLMVVADTFFSSNLHISSCVMHRRKNSGQYEQQHKNMQTVPWRIYYCKEEGFRERKREIYDVIEEYRPGGVIDISQAGMIVSAALFRDKFKIIHIPLGDYSSGAVFHRYIAKSRELCHIENKIYHSIDEEKIIEAPILITYNLGSNKQYIRGKCGLKQSDFVMITVGNRLQYEMDERFLLEIKALLCQYFQIKWIVVGKNLGESFYSHIGEYIGNGQVIEWGFEEELPALYRLCDVYVNPERMGGGGSVLMAMQMEIPVAMTKRASDITPVIRIENCQSDYPGMAHYIIDLMNSEKFRKEEGIKMKRLVDRDELTLESYVDNVLAAYKGIYEEDRRT